MRPPPAPAKPADPTHEAGYNSPPTPCFNNPQRRSRGPRPRRLRTLQQIRSDAGITLRQLGRLTGIAAPTLSLIERGHRVPSRDEWAALEAAVGLTLVLRTMLAHEQEA